MKYLVSSIIAGCAALLALGSCSDDEYTKRYDDPSKTSTVTCEKLMTGLFKMADDYTSPRYYRLWTFDNGLIGRYAQTVGYTNSVGRYVAGDQYINDRWSNFYKVLVQYRILEKTFEELPEVEKPDYTIFPILARIHMYDHMQQIIDMWGDIPYTKAGYLGITGDIQGSYPTYDDATTLYKSMMEDLKAINTRLASYNLTSLERTYLTAQDYINKGELGLWRKYANSLLLRMAMRTADQGALSAESRAIVNEILSNPSNYPLVETADDFIHTTYDEDGFNWKDNLRDGFETSYRGYASAMMIKTLKDDPRLEILYEKNKEGNYEGLDTHDDEGVQQPLLERPLALGGSFYSPVDTATISRNTAYSGVNFLPTESAFLKAEAYQKGYASGNAKVAFQNGVRLAVDYCFDLNAKGTYRDPITRPTDTEIETLSEKIWNDSNDKLTAILTQKWVSFGFFAPIQAWCDVRRTAIPELYFPKDPTTTVCPDIPNRLRYPSSERDNNPHYSDVKGEDTYQKKLFWAK